MIAAHAATESSAELWNRALSILMPDRLSHTVTPRLQSGQKNLRAAGRCRFKCSQPA